MNKKRVVVGVGIVAILAIGAGIWLRRRGPVRSDRATETQGDLAARKRAARGSAPADLTPGSIAGIVKRKRDGAPVPGAIVTVTTRELDLGGGGNGPAPTVIAAGPDGRFEAKDLRPGRYAVSAAAGGFLPARKDVELLPREREEGVEVLLEEGGFELTGVVSDVGGGPIAGARVSASGTLDMFDVVPAAAITGDDGAYRLTLPAGQFTVTASHDEYVSDERMIEIAGTRREDFTLIPGGAVHGRVVTRGDEKPVPNARVSATPGGRDFGATGFGVETDADGRFTVRALPPGEITLRAVARGFGSAEPTLVELGVGEELENVVVYVEPAFTVSGFVVRKANEEEPIPGVLVGGFTIAGRTAVMARAPSEKDGYFEIHGVQPGSYSLFAMGEGLVPSFMTQNFKVVDRDLQDLIVPLDDGVELAGRVDPPVKGARVSLGVEPENMGLGNLSSVIGVGFVRGTTDEQGEFVLSGVPPGKLLLRASLVDGREGKLKVEVADKDQRGLIVKLESRGAIAGRVVDTDGKPVGGVRVRADLKDPKTSMSLGFDHLMDRGAPTSVDGSFRVAGLNPGTYLLAVRDDRGTLSYVPEKTVEVAIEGTNEVQGVLLTVESRNGVIRGVVLGPSGAPVPDAWVTATRKPPEKPKTPADPNAPPVEEKHTVTVSIGVGDEGASGKVESSEGDGPDEGLWESREEKPVLTDAAGRFVIGALRKGVYDLVAQSTKDGLRGETKGAKPGDNVTIRLAAMGELSGVVRAGGTPLADYLLTVDGPKETHARIRKPDGAYAVRRLPPGKYTVKARADAGNASGKVDVKSGEEAHLDLTMVSWGKITGVVVDGKTGKPWKGLTAFAIAKDAMDEETILQMVQGGGPKTDDAGRFSIGRLGAGKGTVMFGTGNLLGFRIVAQKDFVLGEGQTLDLGVLKALAPPDKPVEPGDLGLETDDVNGVLKVEKVTADGPAAKAGLAAGDVILAVDGVTVAEYGHAVVAQLLDEQSVGKGQVVKILLDKKGEVKVTAE